MIYRAPTLFVQRTNDKKSIFLAGTIDMDQAVQWQRHCEQVLGDAYHLFNPRRIDWDATWEATTSNPHFCEQVNWEMDALEVADYILLYLVPESKSPISLLELGLHAASDKLLVVCPTGFWRKGNVDIVCQRYNIPQAPSLEAALNHYQQLLVA